MKASMGAKQYTAMVPLGSDLLGKQAIPNHKLGLTRPKFIDVLGLPLETFEVLAVPCCRNSSGTPETAINSELFDFGLQRIDREKALRQKSNSEWSPIARSKVP